MPEVVLSPGGAFVHHVRIPELTISSVYVTAYFIPPTAIREAKKAYSGSYSITFLYVMNLNADVAFIAYVFIEEPPQISGLL